MIKLAKCNKRNMDISIGLVKANIDLYRNIYYSQRPDEYTRIDHKIMINEEYCKPSFMVLDILGICEKRKNIESFIIINDIKLENNILGYEYYSEKDIERVLNIIKSMADISLIRLGFLNEQTNEIDKYPCLKPIYENIVPTYKKYGFVDVSKIIGGYEGSVVMGIGNKISILENMNTEIENVIPLNSIVPESDTHINTSESNNGNKKIFTNKLKTFIYKLSVLNENKIEIPYIAAIRAKNKYDVIERIKVRNQCTGYQHKDLDYKSHNNEEKYILFKTDKKELVVYLYEINDNKLFTEIQEYHTIDGGIVE